MDYIKFVTFFFTWRFKVNDRGALNLVLDVAIWLVMRIDKELAVQRDEKDLTCLQLLSKMPQVFRSHTSMGPVKSLIYLGIFSTSIFNF